MSTIPNANRLNGLSTCLEYIPRQGSSQCIDLQNKICEADATRNITYIHVADGVIILMTKVTDSLANEAKTPISFV